MTNITNEPREQPLESWKEIAGYLKRDVRTVIRWEKREGLPVHRQMHQARGSVFAYPSELEDWKASRDLRLTATPVITPWRRVTSGVAIAAAMLLALVTMGSGPIRTAPAAAQQVEGTVVRRVWAGPKTDTFGAVSPDGKYLSFVDWETGDLAIRDLATGTNRRLTNKGSWKENPDEEADHSIWSPDGKQIAYMWTEATGYELRLISIDDPKPRVLYRCKNPQDYIEPSDWSPDGKHILTILDHHNGGEQIALVSVANGAVRVLRTFSEEAGVTHAKISPDGGYVVYDFSQSERALARDISLLGVENGEETALINHPADDFALGWTPDGKHVLFASDRTGTLDFWLVPVAEGRMQGAPELVRSSVGRIRSLGLTRKGAFYYGVSGRQEDVYVVKLDPATGRVQELPRKLIKRNEGSNLWPAYSPDGKFLAYVSASGNRFFRNTDALYVRSLKTGEDRGFGRQLRKAGLTYVAFPQWSPDGRSILIVGNDSQNRHGIYKVNLDTGNVVRVFSLAGHIAGGIEWSHDGKAVFYGREEMASSAIQLVKRDLQSSKEVILERMEGAERVMIAASPDGRWLSIMAGPWRDEHFLKVIPVTGGVAKELYRFKKEAGSMPGYQTWSADSRFIIFSMRSPGPAQEAGWDLWRIPVAGGEPQRLGLSWPRVLLQFTSHSDGRHLAFSAWSAPERFSEVWAMENFLPATVASK